MSAAFTRGPWEFECEEQRGARGYWLVADGDYLAMVCRRSAVEEETSNARLIAAAPELYEALERIAANAKQLADDPEQSGRSRRTWSICQEDAETALAKARGQ